MVHFTCTGLCKEINYEMLLSPDLKPSAATFYLFSLYITGALIEEHANN